VSLGLCVDYLWSHKDAVIQTWKATHGMAQSVAYLEFKEGGRRSGGQILPEAEAFLLTDT